MALGLSLSQAPAQGQDRPQPPPQPQTQTTEEEPYRPMSPRERVTFNLEDADLPDLIRLISDITGRRFIVPGKIRSIKATVYAPTQVTAAEAYRAFLSILQLNGLAVVPAGRYLKVVESAGIENQPIPTYTRGGATPADDRYLTRLQRLENITAEDAATLLTRFKSREGQVSSYGPTNTLILTDTGSNIRRMMRVLRAVDVPQTGEQIWIEPVHYADATELATRLQEIFPASGTAGGGSAPARRPTPQRRPVPQNPENSATPAQGAGNVSGPSRVTKILADERTNSLILLATERAYLRILEMIRALDIPLEGEGGIHVHYIQNGDAEEIATTLSSLTSGGGGGARRPAPGAAGAAAGSTAVFEGEIAVTAHAPANALVITSSLHDYASLRRVIERLDAPRRQVFIEAVIMELSLNRTRNLGLSFHGGVPDFPEDGAGLLAGSGASQSLSFPADPSLLTGLALGVRGPNLEGSETTFGLTIPAFGIVLNALASTGDINVLSTPHLIAMDNEEAEITVGQNVPLQTSQVGLGGGLGGLAGLGGLGAQGAQGAAGLGALSGFAGGLGGGVQRQDVGTTLRVTPHINEAGQIRLEIDQEISEADAPSQQGNLGVVTVNRRTAQTQVVVKDQQTVVIGGLIRDVARHSENKVPILGDIPILGMLFRQESTVTEKRNLLLFLTPYIIRDQHDLRAVFERKMRERQEFIDRYFVFGDQDFNPVVDYTRTRGLLAEIIGEIDEIEEEKALMEESARQPARGHEPRPAVGLGGDFDEGGATLIEPRGEPASSPAPTAAPSPTPSTSAASDTQVSATVQSSEKSSGKPERGHR